MYFVGQGPWEGPVEPQQEDTMEQERKRAREQHQNNKKRLKRQWKKLKDKQVREARAVMFIRLMGYFGLLIAGRFNIIFYIYIYKNLFQSFIFFYIIFILLTHISCILKWEEKKIRKYNRKIQLYGVFQSKTLLLGFK